MIQLFQTQKIHGNLWLFLLLLLIQGNAFLFSPITDFTWATSLLFGVSILSLFICAIVLNAICNKFQVFNSPSNLPAFIFILLSGFLSISNYTYTPLIIIVLFLLILYRLFQTYQNPKPEHNYFDIAFLFSTATIIEPIIFCLFPGILLAILALHIFKIRYFILVLIGLMIPWVLYFTAFLFFNQELVPLSSLWMQIELNLQWTKNRLDEVLLLIILLISTLFWISRSHLLENTQRVFLTVCTVFCVFSIPLFFSLISAPVAIWLLLIPLAILFSHTLFYGNKKLANLLLFIFVGMLLAYPWIIN